MLTYADVCWRMLTYDPIPPALETIAVSGTYADVCWRMLTYTDVCWHMLDVCWRMLTYAEVCWGLLTYADVCRRKRSPCPAPLLLLCCISVAALLQLCCISVAKKNDHRVRHLDTTICVSSYYWMCPSHYYVCVLILLQMQQSSNSMCAHVLK
jgi:hypothetical protein